MIQIHIPGEPRGKGRPRFARRGNFVKTYTDDKTASYENLVALAGNQAMCGKPPLDCALAVRVVCHTAPPSSWSNKKRAAALAAEIFPTSKPDLDNVVKALMDALNGIVWVDDKQVVTMAVSKRYGLTPGVVMEVEGAARSTSTYPGQ